MSSRNERKRRPLPTIPLVIGALLALILVVVTAILVDRSLRAVWLDDLDADLERLALVAAETLDATGHQEWATGVSRAGAVRVTLIDAGGVVLADSHQDPAIMENHGDRPEVISALSGEVGVATRVSVSTGIEQRYVALPPVDGLVVRVSTSTGSIAEDYRRTQGVIVRVSLLVALAAVVGMALLVRRLVRPVAVLADHAQALARGRLDTDPPRSPVAELDRLGMALTEIARDLGGRMVEAERASGTLEFVLGAIPQGTILFDSEDRVVYANPAARQILGSVPEALGALTPFQLQTSVREAREGGVPVVRMADHGRPARRLRATAVPFEGDDRVLLVVVDVTERERLDAMRRDFVANASHELKTPVATIIAASEAIQIALSRDDPSAVGFASQIETSARQLDRLVNDLLDLSRLEQETPDLLPLDLSQIVGEEVGRFLKRAKDNGVTLVADLSKAPILGSRRDLAAATRNLLDNALRHTPRGGEVRVDVGVLDDQAVLILTDTGEGIPTRDVGRVFERFYRVDSARSRTTGGTGLGLAIVRHVAETHGGTVGVESELGRGSVFTVKIPHRG
ncbi:MAG: ATP-binding protein [Actinobacteria bacterium]|nr:ATP-binding protein [Actinomycetota bacterium]